MSGLNFVFGFNLMFKQCLQKWFVAFFFEHMLLLSMYHAGFITNHWIQVWAVFFFLLILSQRNEPSQNVYVLVCATLMLTTNKNITLRIFCQIQKPSFMSDNLLDEMYKILSSAMVHLCIAASLVVGAERAVQHVTHMSSRWLH